MTKRTPPPPRPEPTVASPYHGPTEDDEAQADWDAAMMAATPDQIGKFLDALLALPNRQGALSPLSEPRPAEVAEEEKEAPGGPRINSIPRPC